MKLKSLLEGYAWERNTDGSLPTLADTTAAHARKVQEEANSLNDNENKVFTYRLHFNNKESLEEFKRKLNNQSIKKINVVYN